MSDDLLDLSDPPDKGIAASSKSSSGAIDQLQDDPDVYCSVASEDFEDSESLKVQLGVVEAELKTQFDRCTHLQALVSKYELQIKEQSSAFDTQRSDFSRRISVLEDQNHRLTSRIAELEESTPVGITADSESLKKQYEMKLKDVMDKAREHAKKIANERDEFRKQVEDKESKMTHLKQQVAEANQIVDAKVVELSQSTKDLNTWKSKSENLKLQLSRIESLYSTPPSLDTSTIILRCFDTSETEWWLVETNDVEGKKSWWPKSAFNDSQTCSPNIPLLSSSLLESLEASLDATKTELAKIVTEFEEYKKRAETLLSQSSPNLSENRSVSTTPPDMEAVRKLMKAEEEVEKFSSIVSKLNKRISQLESVEKSFRQEIAHHETVISSTKEEVNRVMNKLKESQKNCEKFSATIAAKDTELADLHSKIRNLNSERAMESLIVSSTSPKSVIPKVAASSPDTVPTSSSIHKSNMGTQTINGPSLSSDNSLASPALGGSGNSHSYHDSVVLPLRAQIRSLIEDLDAEKHLHDLTKQQLVAVKEALRRVESDTKFASDLTDPTKIEYMRNVGRKFFTLVPLEVSEEMEQMLPVMLSLFQISPEDIGKMIGDRKKKRTEHAQSSTSSRLVNSFSSSIPKLW